MIPLRPHQQEFIDEFFENKHHGLIAVHPTGSGKTLLALTLAERYLVENPADTVILVAPKTLIFNYQKEMVKMGGVRDISRYRMFTTDGFYFGYSKNEMKNTLFETNKEEDDDEDDDLEESVIPKIKQAILDDSTLNPEEREFLLALNSDLPVTSMAYSSKDSLLVIDEGHNLRTEINLEKGKGKRPFVYIDAANKANRVVILTATPLINYPSDVANLISMVTRGNNGQFMSKKDFEEMMYNRDEKYKQNYFGGKFNFHTLSPEDLAEYPTVTKENVYIKMPDALYEIYKVQEAYLYKESAEEIENDFFEGNLSYFYTGIRQASNLSPEELEGIRTKSNWIKEFIRRQLDTTGQPTQKTVIYSQYIKYGLEIIQEGLDSLGVNYVVIAGKTSTKKRKEAVLSYNEGKIKILLISKSGREGIDLSWTDNIIIFEYGWNVPAERQIIGRGVRRGSHVGHPSKNVQVYRLLMVKPDEFEYGPDRILQIDGKYNHKRQYKSSDLLLMSLAIWKESEIENTFNMIKAYNEAVKKSIEFLQEQGQKGCQVLNQYVMACNWEGPIIFNRTPSKGLIDAVMFNLPPQTLTVYRIPLITVQVTSQCPNMSNIVERKTNVYFESVLGQGYLTIYLSFRRVAEMVKFGSIHAWLSKTVLAYNIRPDQTNQVSIHLIDVLEEMMKKVNIYVVKEDKLRFMKILAKLAIRKKNFTMNLPPTYWTILSDLSPEQGSFVTLSGWSSDVVALEQSYFVQVTAQADSMRTAIRPIHVYTENNELLSFRVNPNEQIGNIFLALKLPTTVLYLNSVPVLGTTLASSLPIDSILTQVPGQKLNMDTFGSKEFKDL